MTDQSIFEDSWVQGSYHWIRDNTYTKMVVNHPVVGKVFVYDDCWFGEPCVGWSPDRREDWCMRLKSGFETAEEAFKWLKQHARDYVPSENQLRHYKETQERRRSRRDFQRKRVYKWERDLFPRHPEMDDLLERGEMLAFIHQVYDLLDVPEKVRPEIWLRGSIGDSAYWWAVMHRLKFPRRLWKRWVVLHEIAHHVVDWSYTEEIPSHGAEFMKVYLELIQLASKIDNQELFDSCREHKLKYDAPDPEFRTFDDKSEFQSIIRRRMSRI